MKKKYPFGGKKLDFHINIKKKSFINPHDKTSIDVLKNINIKIKSKEFVCIVGPSGCGKTTLMNIIGGLIDANDQKFKKEQLDLKSNGDFGYVFQTSRLLPWLTVKENIELVCEENEKYIDRIEFLVLDIYKTTYYIHQSSFTTPRWTYNANKFFRLDLNIYVFKNIDGCFIVWVSK